MTLSTFSNLNRQT